MAKSTTPRARAPAQSFHLLPVSRLRRQEGSAATGRMPIHRLFLQSESLQASAAVRSGLPSHCGEGEECPVLVSAPPFEFL